MQTHRRVFLLLPLALLTLFPFPALAEKVHTVALGVPKRVPYTPPEATPESKGEDATTLRIRPLVIDGKVKEWTVGEMHEITDRTFVIRRALHLNDALPGETNRWSWQPGPWLSVDRVSGRVTALHLPDFDAQLSQAIWFRDYAAYCGLHVLARSTTLTAIVVELGAHRPAVSQKISNWPADPQPHPACAASTWQRLPMRATVHPNGHDPLTFTITGTTSLIESSDEGDD